MYSDLIEPSRSHGWTTGAIIKELQDEIEVENKPGYNKLVVLVYLYNIIEIIQLQSLEELLRKMQNYVTQEDPLFKV